MTDSVTIAGFHYLSGLTVAAFVGGLDCGDYVVDQYGQITVNVGADPDGFFSPSYLVTISKRGGYGDLEMAVDIDDGSSLTTAFVPVVVGLVYSSQGQLLRPYTADEIRSSKGPGLGKRKRAHMVAALVHNTAGLQVGTDFDNMQVAQFRDPATVLPFSQTFDGVYWDVLPDDYTFDTMLAWQIVRPYPATIVQIGAFLNTEDE